MRRRLTQDKNNKVQDSIFVIYLKLRTNTISKKKGPMHIRYMEWGLVHTRYMEGSIYNMKYQTNCVYNGLRDSFGPYLHFLYDFCTCFLVWFSAALTKKLPIQQD